VDGKVDAQSGDPKVLVDSVSTDLKSLGGQTPTSPQGTSAAPAAGGSNSRAPISSSLNTEGSNFSPEEPVPGDKVPTVGTRPPSKKPTSNIPRPPSPPPQRPQPGDFGDSPEPPENFHPDWTAMEITPGGFVVERGVISTNAPMPVESSISGKPPDTGPLSGSNGVPSAVNGGNSAVSSERLVEEQTGSRLTASTELSDISIETLPSIEMEQSAPLSPTSMIGIPVTGQEPSGDAMTLGASVVTASLEPVENSPANETTVLGAEAPHVETTTPPPYIGGSISGAPISSSLNSESSNFSPEGPVPGDEVPPVGTAAPPYILPPTEAYAGQELHMITVILRPGVDKVRDNLRLRQCYGILISYSGHDRFALQIFERNRGYRIEFPNYTTTFCNELVARLAGIVGTDNVIVEPLRLH
jgi:hypothetical protein